MATNPAERTVEAELFGRETRFNYSETWLSYSLLGLRFVMAWVFPPPWSAIFNLLYQLSGDG